MIQTAYLACQEARIGRAPKGAHVPRVQASLGQACRETLEVSQLCEGVTFCTSLL